MGEQAEGVDAKGEGWQKVKGKSPWKQTGRVVGSDLELWMSIYRWRRDTEHRVKDQR